MALTPDEKTYLRVRWRLERMQRQLKALQQTDTQRTPQTQVKHLTTPLPFAGSRKQLAGTITTGEQQFSGYLSVFNVIDQGGDICDPHCFDVTLQNLAALQQRTNARFLMPVLLGHDMDKPVGGVLTAVPDSTGLKITCIVDTTTPAGAAAWSMLSHGYGTGLSIGYIPRKTTFDNAGHRIILQADLVESSVTPLPMNQLATVTSLN